MTERDHVIAAVLEAFRPRASSIMARIAKRALRDVSDDVLREAAQRVIEGRETCVNPIAALKAEAREVSRNRRMTERAIEHVVDRDLCLAERERAAATLARLRRTNRPWLTRSRKATAAPTEAELNRRRNEQIRALAATETDQPEGVS